MSNFALPDAITTRSDSVFVGGGEMATVYAQCPYCRRSERLGIHVPTYVEPSIRRTKWLHDLKIPEGGVGLVDVACGLQCYSCGGYSIGVFVARDEGLQLLRSGAANAVGIEEWRNRIVLASVVPDVGLPKLPQSVPERARIFYVEAKEDLDRGREPAGVIGKCRSVLDVCLKDLNAAGEGRRKKINSLLQRGDLTKGLADWAQRLWDDGNDAIHDLEGSRERASEHVDFLILFFDVAYGLPEQVARAQAHEAISAAVTPS